MAESTFRGSGFDTERLDKDEHSTLRRILPAQSSFLGYPAPKVTKTADDTRTWDRSLIVRSPLSSLGSGRVSSGSSNGSAGYPRPLSEGCNGLEFKEEDMGKLGKSVSFFQRTAGSEQAFDFGSGNTLVSTFH